MGVFMKKLLLIISMFSLAMLIGCNSANFGGGGKSNSSEPRKPIPSDNPPVDPDIEVPPTGGQLEMEDIPDQKVNAGTTSESYSETLLVVLKIKGGDMGGNINVEVKTSTNSPKAGLVQGPPPSFSWTPGYRSSGQYQSEVGEHVVTITATDATGAKVEKSFNVTVKPLQWQNITRDMTDDTDMISDLNILEILHPTRVYNHEGTIGGMQLNTKTCKSFTGGGSIELLEAPRIDHGSPVLDGDAMKHPFTLTYKLPISQQTSDKIALVTWLNFVPDPPTSISGGEAKPILVYFSFARCKSIRDQNECKKATAQEGIQNFYYCSDYYQNTAATAEELKQRFCGLAKLEGVTGEGC